MNGALLAAGVLCAALGLVLAFAASRRALWSGLAVLAAASLLAAVAPVEGGEAAVSACWGAVLAAAVFVHLPRKGAAAIIGLCLVGGALAGLACGAEGRPQHLLAALPWALTAVPGAWLVATGRGLALKVGLSWLAAAAALSLGLHMTPTLGFEPDHMG